MFIKYIFKLILLILPVIFITSFVTTKFVKKDNSFQLCPFISQEKQQKFEENFPYLNLPVNYFSNKDVVWGSAGNGHEGKITDYTSLSLNNKSVYQSYATTVVTIKNYSSNIVPLKIKNIDIVKSDWLALKRANETFQKFGEIITNYLPNDLVESIDKIDVDGDGKLESIVSYNFIGRADGGSYRADIVKENNIIFSSQEDRSIIVPADTNNGFYVEWHSDKDTTGRCCPTGFTRTRFVFKDNKFIPIYEQDVRYLNIGKNEL